MEDWPKNFSQGQGWVRVVIRVSVRDRVRGGGVGLGLGLFRNSYEKHSFYIIRKILRPISHGFNLKSTINGIIFNKNQHYSVQTYLYVLEQKMFGFKRMTSNVNVKRLRNKQQRVLHHVGTTISTA